MPCEIVKHRLPVITTIAIPLLVVVFRATVMQEFNMQFSVSVEMIPMVNMEMAMAVPRDAEEMQMSSVVEPGETASTEQVHVTQITANSLSLTVYSLQFTSAKTIHRRII